MYRDNQGCHHVPNAINGRIEAVGGYERVDSEIVTDSSDSSRYALPIMSSCCTTGSLLVAATSELFDAITFVSIGHNDTWVLQTSKGKVYNELQNPSIREQLVNGKQLNVCSGERPFSVGRNSMYLH